MSKRVHVTLPDTVHSDLDAWAKTRGQAIASLGAIAIEFAVRRAKEDGEFISPNEPRNKSPSLDKETEGSSASQNAIASCMKKIVTGEAFNKGEIEVAAHALGLDPNSLHQKITSLQGKQ